MTRPRPHGPPCERIAVWDALFVVGAIVAAGSVVVSVLYVPYMLWSLFR